MVKTARHQVRVACYMFIFIDGKLLLKKRQNSGFYDGTYDVAAGHLEPNETPLECAIRETKEEVGITVLKSEFLSVIFRQNEMFDLSDKDYIDLFFLCKSFSGVPTNKEPEKCSDMRLFELNDLPTLVPHVAVALKNFIDDKKVLVNMPYLQ